MTDPIADMLTRIRNAQAVLRPIVSIPFSNFKYRIAKILEREKFIEKVEKRSKGKTKEIKVFLKYDNGISGILDLKKISKPGQRIYLSAREIRSVRGGYGIAIISTQKGLMTDKEARRQRLGGEVIAEIW